MVPPSASANSAVMLEKSLPHRETSRSKTPSPRSSGMPMQLTEVANVGSAPSTPPLAWVGYSIGGQVGGVPQLPPPLYWYAVVKALAILRGVASSEQNTQPQAP